MRSIMAGGLRLALGVEREESARIRRILGGGAAKGKDAVDRGRRRPAQFVAWMERVSTQSGIDPSRYAASLVRLSE
jgi:hypothetical protein